MRTFSHSLKQKLCCRVFFCFVCNLKLVDSVFLWFGAQCFIVFFVQLNFGCWCNKKFGFLFVAAKLLREHWVLTKLFVFVVVSFVALKKTNFHLVALACDILFFACHFPAFSLVYIYKRKNRTKWQQPRTKCHTLL